VLVGCRPFNYVSDPKAQALFETSAEVLLGAQTYDDFELKSEPAWK
jgi:hypothetical protein